MYMCDPLFFNNKWQQRNKTKINFLRNCYALRNFDFKWNITIVLYQQYESNNNSKIHNVLLLLLHDYISCYKHSFLLLL